MAVAALAPGRPEDTLQVGASLQSPDGRTTLTLHGNGNMVIEVEGYWVFDDTGPVGPTQCLKVESNGWLVLYGIPDNFRVRATIVGYTLLFLIGAFGVIVTTWGTEDGR